jgi:hypothetical protein
LKFVSRTIPIAKLIGITSLSFCYFIYKTQISKVKRIEICKSNNPDSEADRNQTPCTPGTG